MEGSPNCQLLCRHFDPIGPTLPTRRQMCRHLSCVSAVSAPTVPTVGSVGCVGADMSALSACVEFVIVRPIV